ncbi:hypothetical protein [Rubellicoccus peritrichatus]|uniref:Streptogramin lyase n=1 Tax=Rubellicoccus peritrichatus TaxID=3080537 RepID=A0AAQ3LC07_9BACT|nr:hypothetical protein [Puniceicoccus sp. CR14]WOO42981.1 hypothetical protein RZN69_07740 [Puniceicoccus sp. CR14]
MRFSLLKVVFILVSIGLFAGLRGQSPSCLQSWCMEDTVQDGWCFSPELGWFYGALCPWVYINDRGWFYADGPDEPDGEQWLYNNSNGWLWTSLSSFPFLWSNDLQDWIVYYDITLTEGVVQSGGTGVLTGLGEATISLFFATGTDEPQLLERTSSDEDSSFSFTTPLQDEGGIYYITAAIGDEILLASAYGNEVPQNVTINEMTTVATAYAFVNFFTESGDIRGELLGLEIASGMAANVVNIETGDSSEVLLTSPNADQTNALRSTRNLANLISGCVTDEDTCAELFAVTTPQDGASPSNTLEALINIARNPAESVDDIYSLSQVSQPFLPTLVLPPDAWTIAVKVNDTGDPSFPFSGTANTVFDDRGYAWINNNTIQGESISTMNVIVLKPDGSPSDGINGNPPSVVRGGGILGAGFGITRNKIDGSIWIGNFGWGGDNPGPGGNGSVAHIAADGIAISPSDGLQGGTDRVQGIIVDDDGNVWSASYGNNSIVVFLDGKAERSLVAANVGCGPFGLALAADGTVWASTVGGDIFGQASSCSEPSTVTRWRINDDQTALELISTTTVGEDVKGIDIDVEGYVWVPSGGEDRVYRISPDGSSYVGYQGGGMNNPWCVRIDDGGDIWVANIGPFEVLPGNQVYRNAAVSKIAGPNSRSGQPVGTILSPSTGFTLPSAGAPVLLSDGTPLRDTGDPAQPAFVPFMRSVSAVPDRAGNLWVTNNWKPNFLSNLNGDPGGDGMIIFIGLAAPTEPGRTQ